MITAEKQFHFRWVKGVSNLTFQVTFNFFVCLLIYFDINFCSFRFLVREFVYDEQALEAGKNEITKLESDKKKQFVSYVA